MNQFDRAKQLLIKDKQKYQHNLSSLCKDIEQCVLKHFCAYNLYVFQECNEDAISINVSFSTKSTNKNRKR